MKKIIQGRRYDTETARRIGLAVNDAVTEHTTETLYRKQTGEYFLYTFVITGDENITPLAPDQAREWADAHGYGQKVSFDHAYNKIWLKLPPDLNRRLRRYAEKNHLSLNSAVIDVLEKMLYNEDDRR